MAALGVVLCAIAACGEVGARPDASPGEPDGPAGPTTITVTNQHISGAAANTALVAYQDGDGPWQVVTGTAGVYTLLVASARYGVVAVCERSTPNMLAFVTLGYYAVSDGAQRFVLDNCDISSTPMVSISGTVAGTAMGDQVQISDGSSGTSGTASWTMPAIAGPGSLLATRSSGGRPIGLLLQRTTFAAGATFSFDFASQVFPAESKLTLDPTGSNLFMFTDYRDEAGNQFSIDSAQTAVPTYRVVPQSLLGNGLSEVGQTSSSNTATRSITRAFKTPVDQTLTLPPAYLLASPPHITTTSPYPIAAVTLPKRPDALSYEVSYSASMTGVLEIWSLTYSAAWAGAAGDLVSQLPDLSALPGWKPSFALPATGARNWNASVHTGPARRMTGAFGRAPGRSLEPIQDGDEISSSSSSGSL